MNDIYHVICRVHFLVVVFGKPPVFVTVHEPRIAFRGAWVAQLVKSLSLDFDLGHDLMVHEIKPLVTLCADSSEPAWDSLCLSVSLPLYLSLCPFPLCAFSLSK